jgi:hypothetical protein
MTLRYTESPRLSGLMVRSAAKLRVSNHGASYSK